MTFLALDTSGTFCVLALAEDDGAVLAVSLFQSKRSLSRRLLGEVDGLLSRNSLALSDMTAFAVGLGPGSFTGVRVGVTTAKTLAQVLEKPLVGVGTLDAYASVWLPHDDDTLIVPVLPSRREEVYAAVYRNGERIEDTFAENVYEMQSRVRAMDKVIVSGNARYLTQGRSAAWYGKIMLPQPWTPPEGLCRLAARRLQNGDTDNPFSLVPLYVVAPTITTPKAGQI